MKWSEQMRELISVDENFNQLKLDVDTKKLFINDKFISEVRTASEPDMGISAAYAVSSEDYFKIIKKYPFFTDVKFLLNCIFKRSFNFTKAKELYYYSDEYMVIQNSDSTITLIIYTVTDE